jgi:inosine-uridine nucleoside N-ribohydrolase
MYLSTTDMIAMIIALGMATIMIVMLSYANYKLLQENRNAYRRIRIWRERCKNHTTVPF